MNVMCLGILSGIGDSIKNFFIELGVDVLSGIVGISYWVCMVICIVGLLAYLAGFKKGGRWTTLSIMIYTTLKVILGAVKV